MKKSSEKGFTLIELLVVIAIIAVLSSIVLSSLQIARSKSRDARREVNIKTIQTALQEYYLENDRYPTIGWAHSGEASWDTLETYLGVLQVDPINESGNAASGAYAYSYLGSGNSSFCLGKSYFIVYNKENSNGTGLDDGIAMCDGNTYSYGNAIVVGVDKDGNIK